jgi:hypothetical protein
MGRANAGGTLGAIKTGQTAKAAFFVGQGILGQSWILRIQQRRALPWAGLIQNGNAHRLRSMRQICQRKPA